ncbi:MAG: hypothetical protein EXR47_02805 [Dehalococcoidia bacterium]|nr:hypothetical protein [Dehalococcoidia bacterium]
MSGRPELVEGQRGTNVCNELGQRLPHHVYLLSPGRRTKPENRVFFATREVARAAGYRACKVCRPDEGEYGVWRGEKRQ